MVADPMRVPFHLRDIQAFIDEQVTGQEQVHLPTIVDLTVDFVLGNADLARQFAYQHLRDVVYAAAQRRVAQTRGDLALIDDTVQDRAQFIASASLRWGKWLERTDGRHVQVMRMTRAQCEQAAAERMVRAERDLIIARLWRSLAERVPDDNVTTVGDLYTEEQIEELLHAIQAKPLTLTRNERSWAARLLGRRGSSPQG